MVTNLLLGSWLEACSEERDGMLVTTRPCNSQHQQVGDVVWRLINQRLVHEETQFVLTARQEVNVTPEASELHGRVVSGQARVSPPRAGLSAVVPVSLPGRVTISYQYTSSCSRSVVKTLLPCTGY